MQSAPTGQSTQPSSAPRALAGVFAAIPTPLAADLTPDLDALADLLDDIARQGCHGALVLGTTGEGPSFAVPERLAVLEAAVRWRRERGPGEFTLIAGTGCANVVETGWLSQSALAQGYDAVLLLPPFYFKHVPDDGLTAYFSAVMRNLPATGRVLLYHIPPVTAVPIPMATIAALRTCFPGQIAGLKDSGAQLEHTRQLCAAFPDLAILTGTDSHLLPALQSGGSGSITALASACGSALRHVYDTFRAGEPDVAAHARLEALRAVTERYPTVPAVKALVAARRGLPRWPVRPPLVDLDAMEIRALTLAVAEALAEEPMR